MKRIKREIENESKNIEKEENKENKLLEMLFQLKQ